MKTKKEHKIPKFCVDTNIIYYLSKVMLEDDYFYLEVIDSKNYRYVSDPYKQFPKLKEFEAVGDFSSKEFDRYTRDMRIERVNFKEIYNNPVKFSPYTFRGTSVSKLPRILKDTHLRALEDNSFLERLSYETLFSYCNLLKYIQDGEVDLYITGTTLDEVQYAIERKGLTRIKDFMDLGLIKPIVFTDEKQYKKYVKRVNFLLKKYKRHKLLADIVEKENSDAVIFGESSALMLDLVSDNVGHLITKNGYVDYHKSYEISDAYQKMNYESGCFHCKDIGGERQLGVAPKIITAQDLVKYVRHNVKGRESVRGLQNTPVSKSGLVYKYSSLDL